MRILLLGFVGLLGLAIGSFLNVVIWRVPRAESVVRPRSKCPDCGHDIRPRDDVPVISWLLLRARCRDCGGRIAWRYPLVELLTAGLFVATADRFFEEPWLIPAFLFLMAIAVALSLIDVDTHRLPNAITLPSYPIAVGLLLIATVATHDRAPLIRGLAGMAIYYCIYFVLWIAARGRGLGFGDVKLAGVLGLYLAVAGWHSFAVGALLPSFLGGAFAAALLLLRRANRKTAIAYGPFLILGALVGVLAGGPISQAWLG